MKSISFLYEGNHQYGFSAYPKKAIEEKKVKGPGYLLEEEKSGDKNRCRKQWQKLRSRQESY